MTGLCSDILNSSQCILIRAICQLNAERSHLSFIQEFPEISSLPLFPLAHEYITIVFMIPSRNASTRSIMEHRHINVKDDEWGVTVIHSIWERGSEHDICALIREVKKNPKAADAVKRSIACSQVYGWPKFFSLFLEKIDEKK